VLRAIRMSSPLPMPDDPELRRKVREFPIGYRPSDLGQ
jgi:hypothetical protein